MIEEVDRNRPAADMRTRRDNQTHAHVSMGRDVMQPGGAPIPWPSGQAEGSRPGMGDPMDAGPFPLAPGAVLTAGMHPFPPPYLGPLQSGRP